MSRLSIVVPFYNTESYLRDTLASIARQSHEDLEVIMVNDGSTDGGAAIAAEFARTDRRFTLINQEATGPSKARNVGVAHASGEFLSFVDGDDELPMYACRLMVNSLTATKSDMVAGGVRRFNSAGVWPSTMHAAMFATTALRTHVTKRTVLVRDWTVWNKMFRRSFYQDAALEFPEGMLYEDAPLSVKAHLLASAADVLAPPVYYWRLRESGALSITQRVRDPSFFLDRITSMSMISTFLDEHGAADLRATYEATALAHHFSLIVKALPMAAEDLQRSFLASASAYLRTLAPGALDPLPFRLRSQIGEIASGALPSSQPAGIGARLRKAASRSAHAQVNEVEWDEHELVVRGRADAGGAVSKLQPLSARVLWLRELKSRRMVRLSARAVLRPSDPLGSDAHRSSFEVRLDPAQLRHGDGWQPGSWRYAVAFLNHRGLHRTALKLGEAGPIALPSRQLDGTTRLVPTFKGGMLTLDVVRAPVVLSSLEVRDGVLSLRGQIRLGWVPQQATIRFGRVKGVYEHGAPVRLAPSGSSFEADLRLDDLLAALGPVDIPPVGGALDTWKVVLECTGGKPAEHGIAVGTVPALTAAGTAYAASLYADEDHDLALTIRSSLPVATSLAWEPDAVLVVSGTGPVTDGELVLRGGAGDSGLNRKHRRWPIEATAAGWTARITTMAAPSGGGALPLSLGRWTFLVSSRRADGTRYMTDLPMNPAAVATAGSATAGERTFWLRASVADGAMLVASRVHRDERAERRAQEFLTRTYYPRVRSAEPLADTVLYISSGARSCAGSPRAIHEELAARGSGLTHVWAVRDDQVLAPPGAQTVRTGSQEHVLALATARYVVTDGPLPAWFSRRAGQTVLQTWQGGPVRSIGLDRDDPAPAAAAARAALAADAAKWTYLVSPNAASTPILTQALGFGATILETGHPRNDALHTPPTPRQRAALLDRIGVPEGKKILLYAPSSHDVPEGTDREPAASSLDVEAVEDALGAGYLLLVRNHPSVVREVPEVGDGFVWDVSEYPDVTDLLAVADVLITDYSSLMFDFAVTGRPMIFFAYDLPRYQDGFYFDYLGSVPGPVLATSGEVVAALRDLDEVEAAYRDRYAAFRARYCALDDGHAARRAVDAVFGPAGEPAKPIPAQAVSGRAAAGELSKP